MMAYPACHLVIREWEIYEVFKVANRRFTQFAYSLNKMPVHVDCNFQVGATGAVGTLVGGGVRSVTRLAAGIYKIQLQDNYFHFFGMDARLQAPVTGSNVAVTALTPGLVYQITVLGTTTTAQWVTAGVPVGVTPAVGVAFLAAATSAGTGQAKLLGVSGISTVEIVGVTNTQLGPVGASVQGGYVIIKCLGATDASTTTLIATDPADGSAVYLDLYLSNSSVLIQGE